MKYLAAALVALATILPAAMANFDVYYAGTGGFTGPLWGYRFFANDPSCDQVRAGDGYTWPAKDDVSGNKWGVRCEGAGCRGGGGSIDVMEFNFSKHPLLHYTTYKNRNYGLFGLDGKKYGTCFPFPHHDYFCGLDNGLRTQGHRVMRCLMKSLTAKKINNVRPK